VRDDRKHDGEPKGDFLSRFNSEETTVVSTRPDYSSDQEYLQSILDQSDSFEKRELDWVEQVEGLDHVYEADQSVLVYSDSLENLEYFFFEVDEHNKMGMVENYFLKGFDLDAYPEVERTEGLGEDIALEVKWMLEAEGEK